MIQTGRTPMKKPPPAIKPKPKLIPIGNSNGTKDPVEVYCRLRPIKNAADCVCIKRLNNNTLQLMSFGNNKIESFYTFKYVFPETTNQKELFDRVGLPLIENLVNGKNSLLFTYGITSSGKTFTVTGSSQECGILPRTLDVLFNSIEGNMARKFIFKADEQNGFKIQSTPDALLEWQREKQVSRTPSSLAATPKVRKREVDDLKEWENRERDETLVDIEVKGNAFAVFISYVEIYNNYIYDLLDDEAMVDPFKTQQPRSKVLREDKKRRVFVHNATEIEVSSSDEAFDLFVKGIRRRRMAHTALNTESSRSHSVFNIRVVQAPTDAEGEVILDDKFMTVSQLSLVDLAGSERSQRTQTTGERLREAGNINNSLMALRTCIDLLRENQKYGTNKIVPYRDNKLTHLFKSYFEGEGKIKMIICVNPGAEDFDETLHVMKFAETTQEVLINRATDLPFHLRVSHPYMSRFISFPRLDNNEMVGPSLPVFDKIDWKDSSALNNLITVLEQRKQNELRHHERLRQEYLLFREKLATNESESMLNKQQLNVLRNDLEVRENQLKELETKCSSYENIRDECDRKIQYLEKNLKEKELKLENKIRALNYANVEQERNKIQLEERLEKEKERLKRVFNRVLEEKKSQLERQLCLTNEKMLLVRDILTANNSDWGFFRDYLENLYPSANHHVLT
ncbi:kinesin-like protein KIF23 [Panonychus citri]|uniref:kinesin-like protein KIF23 n=1 Tax=Panonychus citri TaxID=50023 RepID=UPI00230791B3|nr:kinesin-like protein KIF23 [Panonychus citri]